MAFEWFDDFVQETVRAWPAAKPNRRPNPPKVAEILDEMSTREKGDFGERDIAQRLMDCGYSVAFSPGSRSPGDVWGLLVERNVLHLPIKQVKVATGERPETLSENEQRELAGFTTFVHERFGLSQIVPRTLKTRPLIVSSGYAGVLLRPSSDRRRPTMTTKLHSSYPAGHTAPHGLNDAAVRALIDQVHAFVDCREEVFAWSVQ